MSADLIDFCRSFEASIARHWQRVGWRHPDPLPRLRDAAYRGDGARAARLMESIRKTIRRERPWLLENKATARRNAARRGTSISWRGVCDEITICCRRVSVRVWRCGARGRFRGGCAPSFAERAMRWFRRKEQTIEPTEAEDEQPWTDEDDEAELQRLQEQDRQAPFAAMIEYLQRLGFSPDQVVTTVRLVELNRAAVRDAVTASQVVTRSRNQSRRRPKKRKRAQYMQQYRARLRLVTGGT